MVSEIDYELTQIGDGQFRILKFKNGFQEQEYTLNKGKSSWKCSCIGYKAYGYCKHRDWVSAYLNNRALPEFVLPMELLDAEKIRRVVLASVGIRLSKKKVSC